MEHQSNEQVKLGRRGAVWWFRLAASLFSRLYGEVPKITIMRALIEDTKYWSWLYTHKEGEEEDEKGVCGVV